MNCPTCHRPMTRFNDGWRCMNVKAPEHNSAVRGQKKGGVIGKGGSNPNKVRKDRRGKKN